jgi:hypothetical protein
LGAAEYLTEDSFSTLNNYANVLGKLEGLDLASELEYETVREFYRGIINIEEDGESDEEGTI